jgi:hypothetical protein
MPRETTEEEEEENDPLAVSKVYASRTYFEVADQGISKRVGIESVLEDGRRDVGQTRKDDDTWGSGQTTNRTERLTSQEDVPRGQVESIEDIVE